MKSVSKHFSKFFLQWSNLPSIQKCKEVTSPERPACETKEEARRELTDCFAPRFLFPKGKMEGAKWEGQHIGIRWKRDKPNFAFLFPSLTLKTISIVTIPSLRISLDMTHSGRSQDSGTYVEGWPLNTFYTEPILFSTPPKGLGRGALRQAQNSNVLENALYVGQRLRKRMIDSSVCNGSQLSVSSSREGQFWPSYLLTMYWGRLYSMPW